MNGIHDMGGMHGFGPIVREEKRTSVSPQLGRARVRPAHRHTRAYSRRLPQQYRANGPQYILHELLREVVDSRIKGLIDARVLTEAELEARVAFYRDHPETACPTPRRPRPGARVSRPNSDASSSPRAMMCRYSHSSAAVRRSVSGTCTRPAIRGSTLRPWQRGVVERYSLAYGPGRHAHAPQTLHNRLYAVAWEPRMAGRVAGSGHGFVAPPAELWL